MLGNLIKITLRGLLRRRTFSLINITGLAVGMACCLLILLYVADELSYDDFHEKGDRIYRITAISGIGDTSRKYATVPPALATGLAESIPEIEAAVRLFDTIELNGRLEEEPVKIPDVMFVDDGFFDVFTFAMMEGDPATALRDPDSLILTGETARRLFGESSPLGRTVTFGPNRVLSITGVLKDVPRNSHFRFNGLIPSRFFRDQQGRPAPVLTADYFCEVYAYLLLREGVDLPALSEKIAGVVEKRWGELYRQRGTIRGYPLQRLRDIHLKSDQEYDIGQPGNIHTVQLFIGIALLVLGIACFNFINLSTARSTGRAREVGMRKVFGSRRAQLTRQFLGESLALTLISLFLALLMAAAVLPLFNSLASKHLSAVDLIRPPMPAGMLTIVLLTGLVSGSFPAFVLSSFHPIAVLRGRLSSGSRNSPLRKALVILQFAISVFMIIGIVTMVKQLHFVKNTDLGFDKDHLVVVRFFGDLREEEGRRRFDDLKVRIMENPRIISAAFSANVPGGELGYDAYMPEGRHREETIRARNFQVGYDFIDAYGIDLVEGRNFSRDFATDPGQAVLVNQSMARALGWGENILGRRIFNVARDMQEGRIVGVIKDFHSEGLRRAISPAILSLETRFFTFVSIRIRPENISETLAFIEQGLRKVRLAVRPDRPFDFDYYFIDEDFRRKYPEEDKAREIYLSFGVLAVLIACMGLLGLASFTLEQKTKEIGVRKVLGASDRHILVMLTREFTGPVLAAILLAWPLAYYTMHRWLAGFSYRIGLSGDIFLLSGGLGMVIAMLTVGFHSLRAARTHPAESLRYE